MIKKETLDISILDKEPKLDKNIILEIEPLAPLSMVSDLPGSYYKTLKSPSKKMLCGLFENILEWYIDGADRKEIVKQVVKIRKKQKLQFPETNGSGYTPLLMEYFEITCSLTPVIEHHYDDLWTRAFRRTDSYRHTNNVRYFEHTFIEIWRKIKQKISEDKKRNATQKNALLDKLFKRYGANFPMYYGTPTLREYIQLGGNYQIKICIDSSLYKQLNNQLSQSNLCYLGNSEGWVNINIKELQQ